MTDLPRQTDVLVIGAGNAAFAAAHAAREHGRRVTMLERAAEAEAGGNTRFTAGAMRFAYRGVDDLTALMPDLSEEELAITDFGAYAEDRFFDDMGRVTEYRTDPDLCELLVARSRETVMWMRSKGVRFAPIYGRQAFKVGGRFTFWGGLTVEVHGGGPGLLEAWTNAAAREGIEVVYRARADSLIVDDGRVAGAMVRRGGVTVPVRARGVVLACGGFEANPEWRARYLGPGWELAKVRGSRFNTGEGIRMALDIGAAPYGNWSGCHAVGWERNAPEFGDLSVGDHFQKHSYPWGVMLNARGERFVDEGADFRNYTYAKYGRLILEQPGQFAWQVFDAKVADLLRPEYRIRQVTKVRADTLEDLCAGLEDMDSERRARDRRGLQRGGPRRHPVRSERQGRPPDGRARGREVELGQHDRHAALRGLRRDLRHHLHLRQACGSTPRRGCSTATSNRFRGSTPRRARRRPLLLQLSGRDRPHVGVGLRPPRRGHGRETGVRPRVRERSGPG